MAASAIGNGTPCRVAVAGFGTVGRSVVRLLQEMQFPGVELVAICNRHVERKRVDWVDPRVLWTDSIDEVLDQKVDVLVELIGGRSPAESWMHRAFSAGASVVTANKQAMANAGPELLAAAAAAGRHLRFEAAVAGGIPVIGAIQNGLAGDRLARVAGVLNGTCNYILTRMESAGVSFDEALREAQALGVAEADPADDVDGFDARAKLAILASVALGVRASPADIACRSIRSVSAADFQYARRLGCTIRQVAWAELGDLDSLAAAVGPSLVPWSSALARANGSENVVTIRGQFGGDTTFGGRGAGGDPTAVAVVSDILAIARGVDPVRPEVPLRAVTPSNDFIAPFYVRFTVADRAGIVAAIAAVFAEHDISLDAVVQEPGFPASRRPFVITLEGASARNVEHAVLEIAHLDFNVEAPLALPVFAPEPRTKEAV